MKKLLPIYGQIYPLHFTLFNGTNKNTSVKSICLSQDFHDLNFSLSDKNTGINSTLPITFQGISGNTPNNILFVRSIPFPEVNEFNIMPGKYSRPVSEIKYAVMNRKEIFPNNQSGSINNIHCTSTSLAKLSTTEIYITEYRSKYCKLSSLNRLRN